MTPCYWGAESCAKGHAPNCPARKGDPWPRPAPEKLLHRWESVAAPGMAVICRQCKTVSTYPGPDSECPGETVVQAGYLQGGNFSAYPGMGGGA